MLISVPSLPLSSPICSPTASIFSSLTSPGTPITPVFPTSSHSVHTSISDQPAKSHLREPQVLASFHRFAELPLELRRRIWALALPPPRRVELSYTPLSESYRYIDSTECTGYTSRSCIPVALHVTQESRGIATESGYELSFGLLYTEPKVWFKPGCDVIYFSSGCGERNSEVGGLDAYKHFIQAVTLIDPRSLGRVKRMAIEETLFGSLPSSTLGAQTSSSGMCELQEDWRMLQFLESIRMKFTGLEDITFLSKREDIRRGPPFPGLLLPIGWLRERVEGFEGFEGRVGNAVTVVGRGSVGGCEWVVPRWRVVEKGEGRGVG